MIQLPNLPGEDEEAPKALLAAQIVCCPTMPALAVESALVMGVLDHWEPSWGVPGPVSRKVAESFAMTHFAKNGAIAAAAASITDPDDLDAAVRATTDRSGTFCATAATNPNLRRDTRDLLASWGHPAAAARQTASTAAQPGPATLIEAGEAHTIAETLDAPGAAGDTLTELLVTARGEHARTRAAAVRLLTQPARDILIAAVATSSRAVIDIEIVEFVDAAIEAGAVSADDVVARFTPEAAMAAHLRGGPCAGVAADPDAPRAALRRVNRRTAEVYGGTSADWEMLALLGDARSAIRVALSSSEPMTDGDLLAMLAEADAETAMDWASGDMPRRPTPGTVLAFFAAVDDADRLAELSKEAGRHQDLFEGASGGELALALGGVTTRHLPEPAVRVVRYHLQRHLAPDCWEVAMRLLADDTALSVLDITEISAGIIAED